MKNRSFILALFIVFTLGAPQAQARDCNTAKWFIGKFFCKIGNNFRNNKRRQGEPRRASRSQTEAQPPCPDCRNNALRIDTKPQRLPACNLGVGAQRILSTYFRTCNVGAKNRFPDRTRCTYAPGEANHTCPADISGMDYILTKDTYGGQDFTIRTVKNNFPQNYRPGQCRSTVNGVDYSKIPKIFAYGGVPGVSKVGGKTVVDLAHCGTKYRFKQNGSACGIHQKSKPAMGIDCFEVAGVAMLSECMKMHPDEQVVSGKNGELRMKIGGKTRELYTGMGISLARDPNSCITEPTIKFGTKSNGSDPYWPLMHGDMFVESTPGKAAHTLIVTGMRRDPLGIQKAIRSGKDCSRIEVWDFNFDIAQSTGRGSAGPVNVSTEAYKQILDDEGRRLAPMNHIVAFARKACQHAKVKMAKPRKTSQLHQNPHFAIIRHKSLTEGANSKCRYSAETCPKIQGEDCGEQCFGNKCTASTS